MNKILDRVIENRNGHYMHALELDSVYAYESVIEAVCDEFRNEYNDGTYTVDDFSEFFNSMTVIYYVEDGNENKADEQDLYSFAIDVHDYIAEYLF